MVAVDLLTWAGLRVDIRPGHAAGKGTLAARRACSRPGDDISRHRGGALSRQDHRTPAHTRGRGSLRQGVGPTRAPPPAVRGDGTTDGDGRDAAPGHLPGEGTKQTRRRATSPTGPPGARQPRRRGPPSRGFRRDAGTRTGGSGTSIHAPGQRRLREPPGSRRRADEPRGVTPFRGRSGPEPRVDTRLTTGGPWWIFGVASGFRPATASAVTWRSTGNPSDSISGTGSRHAGWPPACPQAQRSPPPGTFAGD